MINLLIIIEKKRRKKNKPVYTLYIFYVQHLLYMQNYVYYMLKFFNSIYFGSVFLDSKVIICVRNASH